MIMYPKNTCQDGVIHDMENTIDKIVEASDEALSIIVVGVGNADFSQMVGKDTAIPLSFIYTYF